MEETFLNFVLVPLGLLVMAGYHVWLLYQIRRKPASTVIGMNAINRRFWVSSMMEDTQKTGVLAVQTLRNNIMASTLLASTAIMLSSLIAVLMTGGVTGGGGGISDHHWIGITFNQDTKFMSTIKFFSILVCFLVSFLMNVQSIRYFSHASMLINVPYKKITNFTSHRLTAEYVGSTVNLGSYFWSLGLRAFYFSFPLFLWLFGAIPMFLCCIFMVFMLYFLDVAFELGWVADEETG
ncbi:hypothetical protein L2E82_46500 [Cichorium intybus]|uniref:Uncharacterized protein n=1 Tax=Cichorium intybus TaxID=13427 RepID=A0ACB8YTA5_CICIN|nr:hypothetical protein L1887_26206 [Cichorium endivia]KAI3688715.1 hypothetical protein L2E82_46500 [Cichorium intybus]